MTVQKSRGYTTEQKARKLFGRMHEELAVLVKQTSQMLTGVNAMRHTLGAVTLTLAEIEAIHLGQTYGKRDADAMLHELQAVLTGIVDAAKAQAIAARTALIGHEQKVDALSKQSKRIATADVLDDEATGPLPGLEYVDIGFFKDQLGCSLPQVRGMLTRNELPAHDAVNFEEGGRPQFLWLKHSAYVALAHLKCAELAKRGQDRPGEAAFN